MRPSKRVKFIPGEARKAIENAKKAQHSRNASNEKSIRLILDSGPLSFADWAKIRLRSNLHKSAERKADREMIRQVERARMFLRRKNKASMPKKSK